MNLLAIWNTSKASEPGQGWARFGGDLCQDARRRAQRLASAATSAWCTNGVTDEEIVLVVVWETGKPESRHDVSGSNLSWADRPMAMAEWAIHDSNRSCMHAKWTI